jgi:hypothetical protein
MYEVFAEGHYPSASTTTELTNKIHFFHYNILSLNIIGIDRVILVELHKARLTLLKSV